MGAPFRDRFNGFRDRFGELRDRSAATSSTVTGSTGRQVGDSPDAVQTPPWRRRGALTAVVLATIAVGTAVAAAAVPEPPAAIWTSPPSAAPTIVSPTPEPTVGSPAPAPANLPVVDYGPAPLGFPPDPDPTNISALVAAAQPTEKIPAYDAPGGQPRAWLAPTISGVSLIMPIVARKADWVGVLLPSANRTIAWLAPGGWSPVQLRDHIVIRRGAHDLTWYRDGAPRQTWSVTLGMPKTPTPLGRTFILGRSTLPGSVYGGVDVLALGSVPDNVDALPAGLRGAHIGIHTWHNDSTLGQDASDGCVRLTKSGQRLLLAEVVPGSAVIVID